MMKRTLGNTRGYKLTVYSSLRACKHHLTSYDPISPVTGHREQEGPSDAHVTAGYHSVTTPAHGTRTAAGKM